MSVDGFIVRGCLELENALTTGSTWSKPSRYGIEIEATKKPEGATPMNVGWHSGATRPKMLSDSSSSST